MTDTEKEAQENKKSSMQQKRKGHSNHFTMFAVGESEVGDAKAR